jgi:hypothetical protein
MQIASCGGHSAVAGEHLHGGFKRVLSVLKVGDGRAVFPEEPPFTRRTTVVKLTSVIQLPAAINSNPHAMPQPIGVQSAVVHAIRS